MKMFISDEKDLNNYGIPTTQGCNFAVYPTDNRSILASAYSSSGNAYLVLTLPNGFRFTGYSMTLKNDLSGTVVGKTFSRSNEWHFYETRSDYDYSEGKYLSHTSLGSSRSDNAYTISRNSTGENDMGDCLYFVFRGNNSSWGGSSRAIIRIEEFVVYFTAESDYHVNLKPIEESSDLRSYR